MTRTGSYSAREHPESRIAAEIVRFNKDVLLDRHNIIDCLQMFDLQANHAFIDIGCGPGALTRIVAGSYPSVSVHGLDRENRFISHAMGEAIGGGLKNARYHVGSIDRIPIKTDTYDHCISRYTFQHLPRADHGIAELIRITKPGGEIGIWERDEGLFCSHPVPRHYRKFVAAEKTRRMFSGGDLYCGRKLYSLFHHAGLTNIRVKHYHQDTTQITREQLVETRWWPTEVDESHPYVAMGRISRQELLEYFEDLRSIILRNDSYVCFSSMFVIGKVDKIGIETPK